MADFSAILSKKADKIVKPPVRPAGTYISVIQGSPSFNKVKTKDGEKPVIQFKIKLISPQSDVDPDQLSEPGLGEVTSWAPLNKDFWVDSPAGEYALTEFLENVLDISKKGKSVAEMLAESPGKQLMVTVIHKPGQNRQTGEAEIYANLGACARA
jgi:hypothetical protein